MKMSPLENASFARFTGGVLTDGHGAQAPQGRALSALLTFDLRRGPPRPFETMKQPKALRNCRPLGVGWGDSHGIREGSLGREGLWIQGRPGRQGGGRASCPARRGQRGSQLSGASAQQWSSGQLGGARATDKSPQFSFLGKCVILVHISLFLIFMF